MIQGVRLHLPNSAHLQNIEGFIRGYDLNGGAEALRVSGHPRYIQMHLVALAVVAGAGPTATYLHWKTSGSVPNVRSVPYLVRMKLFDYLKVKQPRKIEEHEEAGRFVPLTQIRTPEDLRRTITNLIPLLHTNPAVADPIK